MHYNTCYGGKDKKKTERKESFGCFFIGRCYFFCMSYTTCMSFFPSVSASSMVAASL